MKQKLTTTLKLLREHNACGQRKRSTTGYGKLIRFLGDNYHDDKPINLLTILESNGVDDCLWALRATIENSENISRLIAADCAESVLYIYAKKYPDDKRPEQAIKAARDYIKGLLTKEQLRYAAYAASAADADAADADAASAASAAYAAAAADAAAAAYAAAAAAYAYAAAAYAYADAAAARESESKKQEIIIRNYLLED